MTGQAPSYDLEIHQSTKQNSIPVGYIFTTYKKKRCLYSRIPARELWGFSIWVLIYPTELQIPFI